jgi:hypothetical protein
MIPREHFINKIRQLGYKFKDEKKRVSLWRKPGTRHAISLPKTVLLEEEYVQSVLRQAGCLAEEIAAFIASAKS